MESKHYVLKRCGAAKWLARQATAETVVPRFVSIASSHPWKGSGLRGTLLLMFSSVELEAQFITCRVAEPVLFPSTPVLGSGSGSGARCKKGNSNVVVFLDASLIWALFSA